jgi:transposase InsO family protein
MCSVLEVSRSGYYNWLKALPSTRAILNIKLTDIITKLFIDSRSTYGTRRLRRELMVLGYNISRRRIGKLMRKTNLYCKTKRKFKLTTDSKHNLPISPNLLQRKFAVNDADTYYVGDITYIWTAEGWLYLATVIDLFSRKVVGWSMENHMRAELVNNALLMAIWRRKPKPNLVWHTDQGSQYASKSHREILQQHNIKQSMSRKGNCWDNAVAESFFHTLKTELVHHKKFKTREQARYAIFEYIEIFYNRKRRHSANNYLSPCEFEKTNKSA